MLTIHKFATSLEIDFYYLQQNIYSILSYKLNHFTISIFILLFISGLLTSVNPCLISILPMSLSYIIDKKVHYVKKNIFILGLISSLISIILLMLFFNNYYHNLTITIPIFSAFLMILIGLNLLQILPLNFISMDINTINKFNCNVILQDYIIGLIIGLSSSTCSTPILATIIFWISNSKNFLLGVIYIFCYLIGYTSPLIIIMKLTKEYNKLIFFIKTWNYIIPLSGSLILGLGIFSLLNKIFI